MRAPALLAIAHAVLAARLGGLAAAAARASDSPWAHDWATPASMRWGYGAMNGGGVLSDADVAYAARTYRVVVLSACLGAGNASVAAAIMGVAARLKAAAPAMRVLMYFNMQQWACYARDEPDFAYFLARPEWWLRTDAGAPVLNNGSPEFDWTVPAAAAYFAALPVAPPGGGAPVLDGFLLDGAAVYQPEAGVSAARAEAQKLAKWAAVGALQARLAALNGGLALANGIAGGPIDPFANDPFNLGVLAHADAVENERGSPAFELVDAATGALRKDAVAANLAAVERVANGTKALFANYWPGPIVGFGAGGWPTFAPGDRANVAPSGTPAEVVAGWTALLEKWLPFNLAAFLTVAGPATYFTQAAWYASYQGFAPCPAAPGTCVDPAYPDLQRSLGPPRGPRAQVGAYKWVREFEHASVSLDLDDPLGPGTAIAWRAPREGSAIR